MLRHPQVEDRLRESIAAGEDEYVDAVVKETLRVRPVVVDVVRKLTRDTEIAGRLLPEGTYVVPAVALVQLRADAYPDPEAFRPERFLERSYGWDLTVPAEAGEAVRMRRARFAWQDAPPGQVLADVGRAVNTAGGMSERLRVVLASAVELTGAQGAFCSGGDLRERKGMSDATWRRQHAIVEQMVRAMGDDYISKHILPFTQLGRLIRPDEIADAICFMLANSAVSGELWADAGWHAPA